ncbi:MAG TPA: alanine--glyoxylate aminotransferase family protein [Streptosporangiaceae bacterium]|nr:alanine--glyoxylate aminotransferase family protein [Streptosporangiaceae bacterium]
MTASDRRFEPVFTLTAGPTGATPDTLAALGQPVLYHYDPAFLDLYADTVELLRKSFGTRQTPVILHGEAVLGLEAAAASLIRSDDVVLNLVSGVFGKGFGWWARRYAKEVIEVEVPYDSAVPADSVRAALADRPDVSVVAVVHCETPSGTMNDLDAIGPVVAGHGALLIVDAVSSFGGAPCDFAAWDADLVVVGPQKCLGGPPGLSMLHVSDAAWEHMEANPDAPRASMLSILDWKDVHPVDRLFPFTPSVSDIYALHACLEQYLAEGPAAVLRRHQSAARAVRAGAEALGLELWAADRSICSDTVTALKVPAPLDEREVRARARAESGVMLSGGQGDLTGKVIRIGHMGPTAYQMSPVIALAALGRALRGFGIKADVGAAVEAALAALDAPEGSSRD